MILGEHWGGQLGFAELPTAQHQLIILRDQTPAVHTSNRCIMFIDSLLSRAVLATVQSSMADWPTMINAHPS